MSEQETNGAYYDEEAHIAAEVQSRVAMTLGQTILRGLEAEVRGEHTHRKLKSAHELLGETHAEIRQARDAVTALTEERDTLAAEVATETDRARAYKAELGAERTAHAATKRRKGGG